MRDISKLTRPTPPEPERETLDLDKADPTLAASLEAHEEWAQRMKREGAVVRPMRIGKPRTMPDFRFKG